MTDAELMQRADGELELGELDSDERAKVEALGELGELVRGHLELSADALPDKKLDALWREIDKAVDSDSRPVHAPVGFWRLVGRWFDRHRGHLITGAVSAGAVAALALVLRTDRGDDGIPAQGHGPIGVTPAAYRPTEIESLDTPGGTSTVFNLKDEDGSTTVIWVTPEDTVEGI